MLLVNVMITNNCTQSNTALIYIHPLGYGGYRLGYGLGYRGYGYGGHLWKRDAEAEPSIGYYGGK